MNIWKVSHGQSCFKPNELKKLEEECKVCVHKDTPAKGMSHFTQGDAFVKEVKEGDLFYLCLGNQSVQLIGMFTSEITISDDGWAYRKYKLLFNSTQKDTPYEGEIHWWTPNNNSTFIKIKNSERPLFERLILRPYFCKTLQDINEISKEKQVTLFTESLRDVFQRKLQIPDYQRIYCWNESNVIQLLKDCFNLEHEYRLGSIILQKQEDAYDIIDGQQRLVTLSLILQLIGCNDSPLLSQSFSNSEAIQYLRYNKWLIGNYIKQNTQKLGSDKLLDLLTFNVLVLNNESRELAYTFFSNENSRGKALTDFDLLKAHHLRYIYEEPQAQNLSRRWNQLLLNGEKTENYEERDYVRTLALYVFRLRKWLNYEDWDEYERLRVKKEYEAAKTIEKIPPFGEKFDYFEPIQGGTHFFAFVERFVEKYNSFISLPQYKALHNNLVGESHTWLRDTIETFLFAFYIKFGNDYIDDALVLIARIVSQVRYDSLRIHLETILQSAKESKIAMMINRATSPTFCLAQMLAVVEQLPVFDGEKDDSGKPVRRIRTRYHSCLQRMILERMNNNATYTINLEKIIKNV